MLRGQLRRVEEHGVDYIPEDERRSRPSNLFVLLVGGSMTFGVLIIGWYPIAYGLSWWSAFTAIFCGSIVAGIFLGFAGLMGPPSGTNNPVASGAYFGVAGRLIGSLLEATGGLCFASITIWTGGDALAAAMFRFFHVEDNPFVRLSCYGVLSVIVTVLAVYGHHSMIASLKFVLPTAGLLMVIGLFVYGKHFDASYSGTGNYAFHSKVGTWVVSALLSCATSLSYCPYAGDWTRHISPKKYSNRRIAVTLFIGSSLGMGSCYLWGTFTSVAAINAIGSDADAPFVSSIVHAAPIWYVPALVYLGLVSGTGQAVINTYGTGLDTSAIIPRLNRVQATLVACILATAIVYIGYFYNALASWLSTYLQLLICFTVPWVVIAVWGHLRRRGYYNVQDLQVFNRRQKGGIYWFSHGWNPPTVTLWILASIIGMLFSVNDSYTGPFSFLTGGIDGGLVASGIVAAIGVPFIQHFWPDAQELYGGGRTGEGLSETVSNRTATESAGHPRVPTQS